MGVDQQKSARSTYIGQLHLLPIINARNAGLAEANVRIVADAIGQEAVLCVPPGVGQVVYG